MAVDAGIILGDWGVFYLSWIALSSQEVTPLFLGLGSPSGLFTEPMSFR